MTPRSDHRYFLPRHGLAFEASWPRPARTGSSWIRARLHGMVFGGSPQEAVNLEDLGAAMDLLEAQDVEAATTAFTNLGYHVTVRALR